MLIVLLFTIATSALSKEIELETKVTDASIFIKGAEISRSGSAQLSLGEHDILISGLSGSLDPKSIKVDALGDFTILSINSTKDYLNKANPSDKLKKLIVSRNEILDSLTMTDSSLELVTKQANALENNNGIKGSQESSLDQIKSILAYFESEQKRLALSKNKLRTLKKDLELRQKSIGKALRSQYSLEGRPTYTIVLRVSAESSTVGQFKLSYFIEDAGWFPKYDVTVESVSKPMNLTYKAEFFQNSGTDWNNVNLSFTNSTPSESASAPNLSPWRLNYGRNTNFLNSKSKYPIQQNAISGRVLDESGEPLIGVNVLVSGTTVGTITDIDGSYSIELPHGAEFLEISFTGFENIVIPVTQESAEIILNESAALLDEVVITGHSGGSNRYKKQNKPKLAKKEVVSSVVQYETRIEYKLDKPYSIESGAQKRTVRMKSVNILPEYSYLSIPKIIEKAFLVAKIEDWEELNLMSGEANLFFENVFIGRSVLDPIKGEDALVISLGQDKNILVSRKLNKDFTNKKSFSSKKLEKRGFEIIVKNNKPDKIKMTVIDQIPIPAINSIEVESKENSNAIINYAKGELKWNFELEPSSIKKFLNVYEVKFPKNEYIYLD